MNKTVFVFCIILAFLSGCTVYHPVYNGGIHSEWRSGREALKTGRETLFSNSKESLAEGYELIQEYSPQVLSFDMITRAYQEEKTQFEASESVVEPIFYAYEDKIPDSKINNNSWQLSQGKFHSFSVSDSTKSLEIPINVPAASSLILDDELPVHPLNRSSLAFGILGLIFPIIGLPFSILALVFGIRGLIKTVRYSDEYRGKGLAIAGIITGGVGIFLAFIGFVIILALAVGY